jgi:DNA ligase-associated metallophosphoesterase
MNGYALTLAGETLVARPAGSLWWPAARLLAVADLHIGKSGRMARRAGTLLPPYETAETLARLAAEVAAADPAVVVALGDSFDDDACAGEAAPEARAALARLAAGRRWVWVAGNHDPGPHDLPGEAVGAFRLGGLTFRHIAEPGAQGEISGHFHPKARLAGPARPCFLADTARVILPAFGAYTGGLDCREPALSGLMGHGALAILTGRSAIPCPMPRGAAA